MREYLQLKRKSSQYAKYSEIRIPTESEVIYLSFTRMSLKKGFLFCLLCYFFYSFCSLVQDFFSQNYPEDPVRWNIMWFAILKDLVRWSQKRETDIQQAPLNLSLRYLNLQIRKVHKNACPACLVRLTWMVFKMRGKWPYSCCFLVFCFLASNHADGTNSHDSVSSSVFIGHYS